jgi:hypothetical protein
LFLASLCFLAILREVLLSRGLTWLHLFVEGVFNVYGFCAVAEDWSVTVRTVHV